jgi:hypothetical protein
MPEKTECDWVNIAKDFYRKTQFPSCTGTVEGKHIRRKMPTGSVSLLYEYNYKHFLSVLLLALVDANYCFIAVGVGKVGKPRDSNVLRIPT